MKNKSSKKLMTLLLVMIVLFSACGTKQDEVPEEINQVEKENQETEGTEDSETGISGSELASKPLEFFGSTFHDEEGFTFDGFFMTADYEVLESRMSLTETEVESRISEEEVRNAAKLSQVVAYDQVTVSEYPEAVGRIVYSFYDRQFWSGELRIDFQDYESAKEYVKMKHEELVAYNIGEMNEENPYHWGELIEEDGILQSKYLDKHGIQIQIQAQENTNQTGWVLLTFGEPISRGGTTNHDSQYFDFEEAGE